MDYFLGLFSVTMNACGLGHFLFILAQQWMSKVERLYLVMVTPAGSLQVEPGIR